MIQKMSTAFKKKVTLQWAEEFNSLQIYKNMWLLRRLGPIVQGISLDRDSSNTEYLPTFHIHNLINPQGDYISLTLRTPLLSGRHNQPMRISVAGHDKKFNDAANLFRTQLPFSLNGDVKVDDVIDAFKRYIENEITGSPYPINEYFDIVSILIWCDRKEDASKYFTHYSKNIASWPSEITHSAAKQIERFNTLKHYLENPDDVKKSVEDTIENLKLQNLPYASLL